LTDDEIYQLVSEKVEATRKQAMHELQTSKDASKVISAGYEILYSYGFEGNELKKGWRGFSGDFHRF
jgi:hypothetical protein